MGKPITSPWLLNAKGVARDVIAAAKPLEKCTDDELRAKADTFREECQKASNPDKYLDKNLINVFALVYEATKRAVDKTPYPVQIIGGYALHKGYIAEAKTGEGKANPVTTPIPTVNGWRNLGEISVGDKIFDRHGNPTEVTGVFPQGNKQIYRLHLADGRIIDAADEHLWTVYQSSTGDKLITLNTAEMAAKGVKAGKAYRFRLPMNDEVRYDTKNLPVDPYVLGAFIGNGCKNQTHALEFSSGNDFVPNKIANILNVGAMPTNSENYTWHFYNTPKTRVYSDDITNNEEIVNLLSETYSHDKWIPMDYRLADINQRWALLQGLFDTDGCIENNDRFHLTYWTTSPQLRDNVCEIIRSLGIQCSWRTFRKAGTRTAKHDQYCINVNCDNDIKQKFFTLPEKLDRAKLAEKAGHKRKHYDRVAISDIEVLDEETEMVCLMVDNPEHLFLIDDYIVTHNTIMAAMPSFLHALTGKGVHVVTVNPYLADRDANDVGRIHKLLGMSVGCVVPDMTTQQRKEAYACDITYVSNTELGFDYLRDNMAVSSANVVQRGLEYAIVDEVDSILIDEAKTPLIIAGMGKNVSQIYTAVNKCISKMQEGTESRKFNKAEDYLGVERTETGDYIVHEKEKNVVLTAQGVAKIEKAFNIENYADEKNRNLQHVVERCLRAHALMKRDKDYIVRDGKVMIVDEFTGRVQEGRQYSDGLHQAIEAKEHVKISEANKTIGTTTYQNFFRKYRLLAGMTGTAKTEAREFKSTYGLKVKEIPTNKPMIRVDEPDVLFLRAESKHKAAMARIIDARNLGQPVLVGTASVEESEAMSKLLKENSIPHQVLNAKQDAKEAAIVAEAGVHGTVTVATNMAGRGTDIILDDEAKKAGGLLVIGTEKNEAERIDNQLRGRGGRQGDPGTSVFYCSTEDRVMRLYGSDGFRKRLENTAFDNDDPIPTKSVMKAIRSTQRKVELNNFASRRDTLEYDDVNDMQREQIYAERRRILSKDDVEPQFKQMLSALAKDITKKTSHHELGELMKTCFGIQFEEPKKRTSQKKIAKVVETALLMHAEEYTSKMDDDVRKAYIRKCMLRAIDTAWAEQLTALEFAKDSVGYSGYGQRDPKAMYAEKAYELYEKMMQNVRMATAVTFFNGAENTIAMQTESGKMKIKKNKGMEV